MEKTEKFLRLKTRKGKFLNVVREHYLRDDISCHSELCSNCIKGPTALSTSDVTHYIIPDTEVTKVYLELFELPEIQGIIFFQTVINYIQHCGGRKLYSRLKKLTTDTRKQCTVFSNEFCKGAYQPREAGEPVENWHQRCIYNGALWYYNHLKQSMPIIMITNDQQAVKKFGNLTVGLFVLDMADYLQTFWPDYSSMHELYNSLKEVHEEMNARNGDGSSTGFNEYLPLEVLEAGIKSGLYVKGCLNVNKHNAQIEAFVQKSSNMVSGSKESSEADILIHGMAHRNRAVHGDTVVVEVFPQSEWKGKTVALTNHEGNTGDLEEEMSDVLPTARVVGVLQRNWRDYVVCFAEDEETQGQRKGGQKVLVIPWDYRIPRIRISSQQIDSLRNHRIVVRIDFWEESSLYPSGHFVRSLGPIGNLETETAAIMVENSLFTPPFSEAIQRELPQDTPDCPWTMSEEEIRIRRDLRQSHLIFSIDPKGCEDVDDALSVRLIKHGRIELGVHIADVSHFVKPGSLTDSEARARSTTVYLADRRYDMLPEVLSGNLCSLIGGKDRFAVSVLWVLDENFNVLKVWFGRTVIKSSYKMTYEAAQAVADGEVPQEQLVKDIPELQSLNEPEATEKLTELKRSIQKLMIIARHLKAKRINDGALELDSAEVQVELDDKRDVKTLTPKKALEVHETIAECMIFSNHWVAKKIAGTFRTAALLRRHPMPKERYFANLIHCSKAKGFTINTSSNKALANSLNRCTDSRDPTVNKLLRSLATQAMSNALYFSTGSITEDMFYHYGLALEQYTHFTSPIRRYADVIVHRLLMASVAATTNEHLLDNEDLEELCHHINSKHRAAQQAQRESLELFQTLYFQDLPDGDERRYADGVIFSFRSNGALVFIPRYGIKGPVYFKNKSGAVVTPSATSEDQVTFGPGVLNRFDYQITITNPAGTFDFHLFDHIKVYISVNKSRAHAQSLSLELVSMVTVQSSPSDHQGVIDEEYKMKKDQLIKEVVNREDQQRLSDVKSRNLDVEFNKLNLEYGQTHEAVSLYSLFEHFRELSLMDDI